jgi:hypothetical protein
MTDPDPHGRAATAVQEGRPVEAQYVRQGRRGTRILWLLVASTLMAALALFGIQALNSDNLASTREDMGHTAADARAFTQDEPLPPKQDSPRGAPSPD